LEKILFRFKILLEIDSKESIDESKSPRYHRAVWHPLNRNIFAVATDTNDVLVVDINKILENTKEMSFKESDISEKILKFQMQDKVRLFYFWQFKRSFPYQI
jgi:hypothetical protein